MNVRYFEKRPGAWHLDFKTQDGRRLRPYGGRTETAARKAAPGVIAQALVAPAAPKVPDKAPLPVVGGMTLEEAYKLALRTRESWLTSKSKGTLQGTYDQLGLPDTFPVAGLTRDRVRELRSTWMQEPGKRIGTQLSPSTINHRLSMLSVLLEVADLPPHGVKHLSVKGNRRMRRISGAEVSRMLDWCAEYHHRAGAAALAKMIQLALDTCARQGELLGLAWADVGPGEVTFRDTKNGETRTVPLTERAKRLLESRRGLPAPFSDLNADRITALWGDMRASMGLATDEEFVFHTLRHEAISRLVDSGANTFTIMAIAGHSNITTTQVYAKASLGAMRAAMSPKEQQA